MTDRPAARSGTHLLGGDLTVTRMGFGAMRITGDALAEQLDALVSNVASG